MGRALLEHNVGRALLEHPWPKQLGTREQNAADNSTLSLHPRIHKQELSSTRLYLDALHTKIHSNSGQTRRLLGTHADWPCTTFLDYKRGAVAHKIDHRIVPHRGPTHIHGPYSLTYYRPDRRHFFCRGPLLLPPMIALFTPY